MSVAFHKCVTCHMLTKIKFAHFFTMYFFTLQKFVHFSVGPKSRAWELFKYVWHVIFEIQTLEPPDNTGILDFSQDRVNISIYIQAPRLPGYGNVNPSHKPVHLLTDISVFRFICFMKSHLEVQLYLWATICFVDTVLSWRKATIEHQCTVNLNCTVCTV